MPYVALSMLYSQSYWNIRYLSCRFLKVKIKDPYKSLIEKNNTLKFNRDKHNNIFGVFYCTGIVVAK